MPSDLPIGTLIGTAEPTTAYVLAARLTRPPLWCGRICSGKTYARAVLW